MVIELDADLERALAEAAARDGVAPQSLAAEILRESLALRGVLVPRDEWERRLLAIAVDCGVSLPPEALTSDGLYED